MAKYGDLTFNEVEALINKMGGIKAKNRFMQGELKLVETGFTQFGVFPIWERITLGMNSSAEEYLVAINSKKPIQKIEREILKQISVAQTPVEINLVRVNLKEDLEFQSDSRQSVIYSRAKHFGLEICPAEVLLVLALQESSRPKWSVGYVGLEPLAWDNSNWLLGLYGSVLEPTFSRHVTTASFTTLDNFVFVQPVKT
jgi:hypothetical protein